MLSVGLSSLILNGLGIRLLSPVALFLLVFFFYLFGCICAQLHNLMSLSSLNICCKLWIKHTLLCKVNVHCVWVINRLRVVMFTDDVLTFLVSLENFVRVDFIRIVNLAWSFDLSLANITVKLSIICMSEWFAYILFTWLILLDLNCSTSYLLLFSYTKVSIIELFWFENSLLLSFLFLF